MGILKQTNKYKGKTNIPNSKVYKRKGADHKTDKKMSSIDGTRGKQQSYSRLGSGISRKNGLPST